MISLVDQQEWAFTVRGDRRLDTGLARYCLNPDLPSMDWLNFAIPHHAQAEHFQAFLREAMSVFEEHNSLLRVVMRTQPAAEIVALLRAYGLCQRRLVRLLLARPHPCPRPPGLQVDLLSEGHLREFVGVSLRAFRGESCHWSRSADQLLEFATRRYERGERFYLARLEGEPVGAVTLMPGLIRQITTLAVRSPARRRGVGSALLDQLVQTALQEGAWGVWLTAEQGSLAEGIYRRRGFERLCERYEYFA